jgi:hypothetical protein
LLLKEPAMSLSLMPALAADAAHAGSLAGSAEERAWALLGDRPTITVISDAAHCTVRCVRVGQAFVGVVPDHAALTDRIRLGGAPTFLAGSAGRADVVALAGQTRARVLGRLTEVPAVVAAAVASLVGPYASDDAVVIEVRLERVELLADDEQPGAVPRT